MPTPAITFELHLTTADLPRNQLDVFVGVCIRYGGKPLLIELSRGEYTRQPMFSKVIYADKPKEAIHQASSHVQSLRASGFQTTRVKIEVPSAYAGLFQSFRVATFEPYFEWHGKIPFLRVSQLLELCSNHGVHLSRNSLKDEHASRFVTLREFRSSEAFQQRIDALVKALEQGGWFVGKQQSEYCLYDTNTVLDNGWLSQ
jgi:hypothetical protein